jgi:hypothetical protein
MNTPQIPIQQNTIDIRSKVHLSATGKKARKSIQPANHFDEESDRSLVASVTPSYARARVLGIVSWQKSRRNGRAK